MDNGCVISDALLDDSLLAQVIDEAAYDDMALIEMPDEGRKYLTVMVRRGEEHVCQLLMGDEGGAFTPCTQDLLLRFRLVLERIAQQGLRLGGLPSPENNSCVRRLLDHIYVREEVLDGYLRKRGWHFEDEYYCIMVQTSGKDAQMVRQMLLRQIRSGALHGSVVLSYEDEIACVVNGAVLPYDRAFLLESLGSIAKRFPARFGVSNVFHDFRETKRYYDTCRLALAYGELEEPERAVCLFEDYAPRHLEKVLFSRSVNEALLDAHAARVPGVWPEQDACRSGALHSPQHARLPHRRDREDGRRGPGCARRGPALPPHVHVPVPPFAEVIKAGYLHRAICANLTKGLFLFMVV